ncbi:MAG: pyridoxal-phosphate dependent enzyme [Gammaproteobacteria bacterium]|nr:pyridoxal-phosphate dependent enzyme [Gammaproteobacteria bacterium]
MRPIYNKYPGLIDSLPLVQLAELPTPVRPLEKFSSVIGQNVFIKQDQNSGAKYGGNKVRKLEFLLADAVAQDYNEVVTYGAAGSNHALATSIYAKQLGLKCYVILSHQPYTSKVAKTLRYHLQLGSNIIPAADYPAMLRVSAEVRARCQDNGKKLYEIPFGGSSAIGTIGFVNAALELATQISNNAIPHPERIYIACGTSGSATGLSIGLRLAKLNTQVIATQVTPSSISGKAAHSRLFEETNQLLHSLDNSIPLLNDPLDNITHREDQYGPGYAESTIAAEQAIKLIHDLESTRLETTYTGKALATLIDDAKTETCAHTAIFWNTYNARPYPNTDKQLDTSLPAELQKYLG